MMTTEAFTIRGKDWPLTIKVADETLTLYVRDTTGHRFYDVEQAKNLSRLVLNYVTVMYVAQGMREQNGTET